MHVRQYDSVSVRVREIFADTRMWGWRAREAASGGEMREIRESAGQKERA